MGFSKRSDRQIEEMIGRLDDLVWGFEYGRTFDLKGGVSFKLGNAGHILGSCFIRLESWVNAMEKRPGTIRLVHGEPKAKQALFKIFGL